MKETWSACARAMAHGWIGTLALVLVLTAGQASVAEEADHDQGSESAESHHEDVTLSPEAAQSAGVQVRSVRSELVTETIKVSARVAYNQEAVAHVGTPVEGRVTELPARVGMTVAEGDLLVVLSSAVLGEAQSDFLQKASAVEVVRTTVEVARKALDRAAELEPGKGVTVSEFQTREGNLKLAEGALIGAGAAMKAAENRLHILGMSQEQIAELIRTGEVSPRLELRAPIPGQIVEREVTLGEIVGPERDALMVVADLSNLWVLADVAERDVARVTNGSNARLTFDGLPGLSFAASVEHVSAELNAKTRKALARLVISGPPQIEERLGANECQHHLKRDECPFCTPGIVQSLGLCAEHGVPEALCYQCDARLLLAFKAEGDWCREHDRPDSQCEFCNPGYKDRYAPGIPDVPAEPAETSYTPEQIADYKARGDWCAGHGVPESKCALCNPDLASEGSLAAPEPVAAEETQPGTLLRPGMFGEAEIQLAPAPGRGSGASLVVPRAAIQRMEGTVSVFVELQDRPGTYRRRPVAIGESAGPVVSILGGLDEGESVVVAGAYILKAEIGKLNVSGCADE
ncbi:efflux RND transporter periplasmic adaptor subunit [Candidatus Poribacteria bacterium]|nr:efflux RND transporter periplasmic adaptor subunit [Candidatus Poribacteria bacterium]